MSPTRIKNKDAREQEKEKKRGKIRKKEVKHKNNYLP
jgi:hypothetical protein